MTKDQRDQRRFIQALAFITGIKKARKSAGPVHDGFHTMLKMFDPTNRFLEENDAFATRAPYEREKERSFINTNFKG